LEKILPVTVQLQCVGVCSGSLAIMTLNVYSTISVF